MSAPSSLKSGPSPLWRLVGGDLSLDFANTLSGRVIDGVSGKDGRVPVETLRTYADLLRWARLSGCAGVGQARRLEQRAKVEPARALATLARAFNLREASYRILLRLVERTSPARADLDILNEELRIAKAQQAFEYRDGALTEAWLQANERMDSVLWPICIAAGRLFAEGPLQRLKICPGRACGWLFLDRTRNDSRRWCSMKDCGNPSKVRSFRLRCSGLASGRVS